MFNSCPLEPGPPVCVRPCMHAAAVCAAALDLLASPGARSLVIETGRALVQLVPDRRDQIGQLAIVPAHEAEVMLTVDVSDDLVPADMGPVGITLVVDRARRVAGLRPLPAATLGFVREPAKAGDRTRSVTLIIGGWSVWVEGFWAVGETEVEGSWISNA